MVLLKMVSPYVFLIITNLVELLILKSMCLYNFNKNKKSTVSKLQMSLDLETLSCKRFGKSIEYKAIHHSIV